MTKFSTPLRTLTAFCDDNWLACGSAADIKLAILTAMKTQPNSRYLCFDDESGECIDLDLFSNQKRRPTGARKGRPPSLNPPAPARRKVGRPSLGVVAREVTLLPRHWAWLQKQPASASSTLRKLIDDAVRAGDGHANAQIAMARADRFMSSMLGDLPGYEEASRALYRGDKERFDLMIDDWPGDLKDYVAQLSAPAFIATMSTGGRVR